MGLPLDLLSLSGLGLAGALGLVDLLGSWGGSGWGGDVGWSGGDWGGDLLDLLLGDVDLLGNSSDGDLLGGVGPGGGLGGLSSTGRLLVSRGSSCSFGHLFEFDTVIALSFNCSELQILILIGLNLITGVKNEGFLMGQVSFWRPEKALA